MSEEKIFILSDIAVAAQTEIQKDFKNIDPVIGLIRNMRESGFPADAMTIDCRVSGKRIILILHDDKPEEVDFQFGLIEKDPHDDFESILFSEVNKVQIYTWIKTYFSK